MVFFHIVYPLQSFAACIAWWEGLMRRNANARNFCVSYSSSRALYSPWSFPNGGRQTQRYFNASTPSSRRDNNTKWIRMLWRIEESQIISRKLEIISGKYQKNAINDAKQISSNVVIRVKMMNIMLSYST